MEFEGAFLKETRKLLLERTRLAVLVGMFLYGSFWLLDVVVARELSTLFLQIRLVVLTLAGTAIAMTYTAIGKRHLVAISAGVIWIASVGISLMTVALGGFSSDYYAGNLMVLFMVGLFMPWSLTVTTVFCLTLMGGYFGLNSFFYELSKDVVSPAFFLAGTAVFACYSAFVGERSRREDLRLRLDLQQANDDLTRIDEAKTRFFSNVSHELRTPLTMMLGPAEALLRQESHPERASLLRAVLENSRRLLRQVNLLLDWAKVESGTLTLEAEPNNLGELLEELVEASRPHAGRRHQVLELHVGEGLGDSYFDRGKVEVIAANLLSNALKFTGEGGKISVRVFADHEETVLEVEDTGQGIPGDQVEKVFDRFHQVDTSLSREEGTGLGLSLARELARLHGGDIVVSSKPGQGSVFRVSLPRHPGQSIEERRQKNRRKEDRLAKARKEHFAARMLEKRARRDLLLADLKESKLASSLEDDEEDGHLEKALILVVDDNADLRAFLKNQLSRHYRVKTARDGREGLKKAREDRPNLIVLDVMMPRMDGYEMCRRLKSDAGLAAIPVVLVTAKAGSEAVVEGLDIGAEDYVTKPFSIEELEARIAAHLRAKETERQLHEKESRLAAIGQLTSGVVHDVRNTLMLIQGYSDLARSAAEKGGSPADVSAELDQVKIAAQRLRRMTTEILEFARGGSQLNRRALPAFDYLTGTLSALVNHLEGLGIEVKTRVEIEKDVVVTLDPDRFQRVLENLFFNARDALLEHEGEREVYVQAGCRAGTLEIRIADTGPGIAPDIAGRLFEPFASLKKKGTGLGLATVRNLAKAHGGEVRVEPKAPEGGAAFTVVVPLKDQARIQGLARVAPARPA